MRILAYMEIVRLIETMDRHPIGAIFLVLCLVVVRDIEVSKQLKSIVKINREKL